MSRPARNRSLAALTLLGAGSLLLGADAAAFEIDYSVHSSTYAVTGSETATSLIAAFDASSPTLCDGVSLSGFTDVSSDSICGGGNSDLAYRIDLTFTLGSSTHFTFDAGMDWGNGGGVIIDGSLAYLTTDNLWWANDWNSSAVIETDHTFSAGTHTLTWIGFEDCCNGMSSIRFLVEGGTWQALNETNFAPHEGTPANDVPVPAVWALMAPLLYRIRRRA